MGNCATVQVGAYVESCVGKPCSSVCPTGSCPNAGWVCNSGVCNAPYVPTADCTLNTNWCTPSCLDKSTCVQCPSKAGCGGVIDVPGCTTPCQPGYICNGSLHQCVKSTIVDEYDTYGCNKTKGETWCAARLSCHIESTDPCNPIVPITPPILPIIPPIEPIEPIAPTEPIEPTEPGDTTSNMFGLSPQMLLLLGIGLIGGFVMMSGRK